MSPGLISRSADLKRLRDEGFEVEVRSGFLLVHSVPYVNARREVARGTLLSVLTLAGDVTATPHDHVVQFIGDHPCTKDGVEIGQIKHGPSGQLAEGLTANYSFSNKPAGGYADYYEKMTGYIGIISAPAKALNTEVDARTFKVIESGAESSVLRYFDSASSRAGITAVSDRLRAQKVGIVGLGGTGAYILDFVAKTLVAEIHLFDNDLFLQHNAFRSPGAPSREELTAQTPKVDYLKGIYDKMHGGIVAHNVRIDESNLSLLGACDFVFVCVDKGSTRKLILEYLMSQGISFVDAGMGVELSDQERLWGTCRITAGTSAKVDHIETRVPMADVEGDDLYSQNIQIAELNALNAVMAVIKWKKFRGIYEDLEVEFHSTFSTNLNLLTSDERLI